MGVQNFIIFLLLSTLLLPFIFAIGLLVLVMTCGWSKLIRQKYVDTLLKIFDVRQVYLFKKNIS